MKSVGIEFKQKTHWLHIPSGLIIFFEETENIFSYNKSHYLFQGVKR